MLTDDLRGRIHAAMGQSHAKTHGAAKLLGMPWQTLQKYIRDDDELQAKWGKGKRVAAPGEESLIHRPVATEPVALHEALHEEDAAEIAKRLEAEDALVRQGLAGMGFTGDAQSKFRAMEKFHGAHYTKSLQALGGGMTKLFFELWAELDKVSEAIDLHKDDNVKQVILRKDRASMIEALQRIYDRANKAALQMAMAKHKMSDRTGPGEKSVGKPAFSPLLEAGEKVSR